jgi:hypothetical protein
VRRGKFGRAGGRWYLITVSTRLYYAAIAQHTRSDNLRSSHGEGWLLYLFETCKCRSAPG